MGPQQNMTVLFINGRERPAPTEGWSTGAPVLLEKAGLRMEKIASQGPKCARDGDGRQESGGGSSIKAGGPWENHTV